MSITHCSSLNEVCNDLAMSGSATVTIVTSTRSMNVPAQIAASGSHLRMPSWLRPVAEER